MQRITSRWRILSLAIPAALAATLMALVVLGGSGTGTHTLATGPTPAPVPDLTGVSCADVYVDLDNNGIADDLQTPPNGIGPDDITSLTMSRTEPHQGGPSGTYDVTTVSYLGKAPVGGLVPGGPPGPGCSSTTTAAATSAEANVFSGAYQVPYANQYGTRPTALATYTDSPVGQGHLTFSTCGYSETLTAWVRIDSDTHITKTGPGSANSGVGTLYLAADPPMSGGFDNNGDGVIDATTVPTSCATTGAFPYHFVFTAYGRNARTDHWAANDGACSGDTACLRNRALGIALEADGPNSPKTKGTPQSPDGTTESTFVADDWDGDGCPDWDELGRGYMGQTPTPPPLSYPPAYNWATNPVNGMDPFNPNDCDHNFASTLSLDTTVFHNTGGATSGQNAAGCGIVDIVNDTCTIGNGSYFHCLADVTDGKLASPNPLTFRLGCYSDSTLTVINTNYDRAYDPSLGEDGYPANSCSDGLNNSLTTPTPPATPDMVKDSADPDCHASTCPGAKADMCGDGKAGAPPPGCRSAQASTPPATPVPPCAGSLPNASDSFSGSGHCAATNKGPGLFYVVTISCHPERWVYTTISASEYPVVATGDTVSNYYDATTNQIHIGGCFPNLAGAAFGPNVWGEGLIDAHTGAGSFKIWIQLTSPTCVHSGSPTITGSVTIVELQSKKGVTAADLATPVPCISAGVCKLYDSDGDGCPDIMELSPPENNGGLRDPYNKWDYFDPFKEMSPPGGLRKHTSADMLTVQQHFGANEWIKNPSDQTQPPVLNDGVVNPNIKAYSPAYDRTAIVGSNNWDLSAGDGYINAHDMLAVQKSFGDNCPHS